MIATNPHEFDPHVSCPSSCLPLGPAAVPAPRHAAGASLPCVTDLLGLDDWEALEHIGPLDLVEEGGASGETELTHYWEPLPPSEFNLRGKEYFR